MTSSYVADESRQCGTKRRYASSSEAKRVAKHTMARGGNVVHQYRCEHCGWWHVGHSARWRKFVGKGQYT
jgi:hypothetical protein